MKKFNVIANGTNMGTFEASDKQGAILAAVNDAGYGSVADAGMAVNLNVDDFVAQVEVEEVSEVPVFESNCNTSPDFYADPYSYENKRNENAYPTSRCLSGSNDFWAAEEWAEPVVAPDGRKATKFYLFAAEDIADDDGNALDAGDYPWDAAHVSRIVIDQD